MPIVTLTSDFGLTDYYVSAFKGAMLSWNKELVIVDISHNVNNYDIVQGAFMLKNAYPNFPKGSIHVININSYYAKERCFLAIRYDDHYFIGPDNGLFSLMFESPDQDMYELDYNEELGFSIQEVYARAVGHIANNLPFNEIGLPVDSIYKRITIQPVISHSQIRGSVIHIDNYENVIVNIKRDLFEKVQEGRSFEISFRRHEPLTRLVRNYAEVPVGEPLCFFNSAGYLEIAINLGKAASLLGLYLEDMIQIDFTAKQE